jgi:hypothetical protein
MSRLFRKKYRWDAAIVNDLVSCRQYLDGKAPQDNQKFVIEILNKAIRYSLQHHPFFKSAIAIDEADRSGGKVIDLKIGRENWLGVQVVIDQLRAMNESDLMQFAVQHYLEIVKSRRSLPEDSSYKLEESAGQLQT